MDVRLKYGHQRRIKKPKSFTFGTQKKDLNTLINFNGNLISPETPVASASNRSLRYGDGLFETMYWDGQRIRNEDFHLDRLFLGCHILNFDLSGGFNREMLSGEIIRLCENNARSIKARVRLNVYREDGSMLLPQKNKPVFLVETNIFPKQHLTPLRLTVYPEEKKSYGVLSNLKTNNYLLNILAIQFANRNHFDDAVILNGDGNICEASSSNLFMVRKGIFYTPSLSEACVAGTKRRELLGLLPGLGFRVEEANISAEMLFKMEEVFLTNAIQSIRPVKNIDGRFYSHECTNMLIHLMNMDKE